MLPGLLSASSFVIRPYEPGDEAAMLTVSATLQAADAGDLLAWSQRLDDTLEAGGAAWVVARGRRISGYAVVSPVPGLPGVFELNGGIASPWQQRGLGGRLLAEVKRDSPSIGVNRLSCFVPDLAGYTSRFLLEREFFMEHEECLLELDLAHRLLPAPEPINDLELVTLPRAEAVALFPAMYEQSFAGLPWSQPYTSAETDVLLDEADDLLFALLGGEPVGVAWLETTAPGHGRIEPIGIVARYQKRGYGRWLLDAALRRFQERGVHVVQLGLWRDNAVALDLYKRAGFIEVSNWYYLACDNLSSE